MLDVVLPLAIAVAGALLTAIPFAVERRGARPPPSLRMAGLFFAVWGVRDVVYGAVTSPPFAPRLVAGMTALAAGAAVIRSTYPRARRGTGTAALVLGLLHLILAALDLWLSR